jgi:ribosomal small subunit protein bTHX
MSRSACACRGRIHGQDDFASPSAGRYGHFRLASTRKPLSGRHFLVALQRRAGKLRAVLVFPDQHLHVLCAHWNQIGEWVMGRGDRKTRKGKRAIRSYGNVRPHNAMTTPTGPVVKKAAPAKAAVKKAAPAARKAAPRKAT